MTSRHRSARPRSRTIAVVAAGTLALGLLPLGVSAQTAPPDARGIDRICIEPYENDFDDIAGSPHTNAIRCIADLGVAEGVGDGTSYAPRRDVTRGQMASFIARTIEGYTGEELPAGNPSRFNDVPASGYTHSAAINSLAEVGVVEGTNASGGQAYAPQATVTRAQMASFVRRALSFIDTGAVNDSAPPAAPVRYFDDVDSGPHVGSVNALAHVGIVQGFGDGRYGPNDPVRRDQMASFIARSADYAVEVLLGVDLELLEVDPAFGDEVNELEGGDDADYTVDVSVVAEALEELGLPSDEVTYRITLVEADNIDFNGGVFFATTEANDAPGVVVADAGPPEAILSSVNGEDTEFGADDPQHTVGDVEAQEDDTITFTASTDAEAIESFIPVIYVDEGLSTFLEVRAENDGRPIEIFGIGQQVDARPDFDVFDVAGAPPTLPAGAPLDYTVGDLDDDEDYRITLVDADLLDTNDEGRTTFTPTDAADAPGVVTANAGPPASILTAVNGQDIDFGDDDPQHTVGGVSPEDGTLTFSAEVAGELGDEFVAVVYVDGGASTFLELAGDDRPIEWFGVSGETVVVAVP